MRSIAEANGRRTADRAPCRSSRVKRSAGTHQELAWQQQQAAGRGRRIAAGSAAGPIVRRAPVRGYCRRCAVARPPVPCSRHRETRNTASSKRFLPPAPSTPKPGTQHPTPRTEHPDPSPQSPVSSLQVRPAPGHSLSSRPDRGASMSPGSLPLQLTGQTEQTRLLPQRRDELHAAGQTVGGPV